MMGFLRLPRLGQLLKEFLGGKLAQKILAEQHHAINGRWEELLF